MYAMETFQNINKPSKDEQRIALKSYDTLAPIIKQLTSDNPEIEIEETQDRIKIPLSALKLLGDILEAMSKGKPFSLVPIATEVTTQKAAEILGCSRPHFVKLLESGEIAFTKIGKHRRVKFEDVLKYKTKMKAAQKKHLIDMMQSDEETGLYDS
jgi:excisionase family DNA binding protein